MSWLFGVISPHVSQKDLVRFQSIHDPHLFQIITEQSHYFAAGGNTQTCFSGSSVDHNSFWIGLGILLQNDSQHSTILSAQGWKAFADAKNSFLGVNGHYVFLKHSDNTYEIRTDILGLRTIYWSQRNDEIIISTRIDWITEYYGGSEIDYQSTGTRWLLFNQLGYQSLVKGIHRLGPDGTLTIRNGAVVSSEHPFTPTFDKSNFSKKNLVDRLLSYVAPKTNGSKIITLGLSGGLDSRVLLALLLSSNNTNFQTHTFGDVRDPDVFIPKQIADRERFGHFIYNKTITSSSVLVSLLQHYASETNLIEPISTALRLQNIPSLDPATYIMIDGGFGEIARRQYMNRLALYGKNPFLENDIELIYKNLRVQKGNFFHQEIVHQMEIGARNDIQQMLAAMPSVEGLGLENYLDLWAVRSRFPNFGSDEQARLDKQIVNYMPFAQPDVVNMIFSIPVSLKRNGKFSRELIISNYPSLKQYSLVKSGMTYPFSLSTKASWLYTKIKSTLGFQYTENKIDPFLTMMKEYIMDILYSKNVREHPAYHFEHISNAVDRYYRGDKSYRTEVVWWLSFELWRRGIERK